ncbi:MAG: hypothetical protein JWO58_1168 [Chitinophagaceae bacterium]|nr:hypothetical protein [Chitinophagaceae bacterium]
MVRIVFILLNPAIIMKHTMSLSLRIALLLAQLLLLFDQQEFLVQPILTVDPE